MPRGALTQPPFRSWSSRGLRSSSGTWTPEQFGWVRVGCSISSASGRFCEPGVPPLERRLETLRALGEGGMRTWVSLAPVSPGDHHDQARGAHLAATRRRRGTVSPQDCSGSRAMTSPGRCSSGRPAWPQRQPWQAERMSWRRARGAIADRGFEDPEEFFGWSEPRDGGRRNVEDVVQAGAYLGGLDEFLKPEAPPSAETGGLHLAHA